MKFSLCIFVELTKVASGEKRRHGAILEMVSWPRERKRNGQAKKPRSFKHIWALGALNIREITETDRQRGEKRNEAFKNTDFCPIHKSKVRKLYYF